MADDELSAPLGQNAKKKRRRFRLPIRIPHVIAGAARAVRAGLRGLGAGGRRSARRRAGRGRRDRLRSAQIRTGAADRGVGARPAQLRRAGAPAPKQAPVPTPAQPAAAARPAADAQHQDRHHHRRLDRQAPGGRRSRRRATSARRSSSACSRPRATAPSRASRPTARARPRSMPAPRRRSRARKDGPRIAIVIGGLGVSANATRQAMAKLPGAGDLRVHALRRRRRAAWSTSARADGHEVLLQAPMEPFDYPDNDPGPQTLLTTLSRRAEYRPPALADEPLPGLRRHRQLHGRALHLDRSRRWRRC